MSEPNVKTIDNSKDAYKIIRLAFLGGIVLSGLITVTAMLTGNAEAFTVGATLTGSSITGMLSFIAGRKV